MTQQENPQPAEQTERRDQPRDNQPNAAEVLIRRPDGDVSFKAVLVNSSPGGMCIRHWRRDLAVGQQLRLSSPALHNSEARVVWNWAVGPVVISGLQKIESPSDHRGLLLRFPSNSIHTIRSGEEVSAAKRMKVRMYLLGTASGIVLIAGWIFRTKLWHLWRLS
jgi:hypothetical protein